MITAHDILTSSGKYPERMLWDECTQEVMENSKTLALRISDLMAEVMNHFVSSGFRTSQSNVDAGGSKKSNHMKGQAVDLINIGHYLKKDYLANKEKSLLVKHDLYLEDPDYTPTWTHLQSVAPKSGRRIFIP